MANIDGDITLGVQITPENVQETAKSIHRELEGIFHSVSGKALSDEFKRVQAQAVRLDDTMQDLVNRMDLLKRTGAAYTGEFGDIPTEEYQRLSNRLNQVTNSAVTVKKHLKQLSGAQPPTSAWDAFRQTVGRLADVALANAGKRAANFIKQLGSNVLNAAASKIKNIGSAMSSFGKSTRHSNNMLELGFKKLVQYGFGIRTIFLLVKKLRQALIDGFGYMTQYSGEFNNTVSQFVSALNTLKLAFATAFAPIASVALPLLTALANALITVMNIIGKFFAALTGKSTFIQAKRNQTDYAASLDKTAKSGGKAAKGIKKAEKAAKDAQKTIAGFDDVEILHDKSKDDAGAGGGGGGGGGGLGDIGKLNGADMFETVGIESRIKDFADKLRDLIGAQDWTGLGTFLGQCINSIFEKAKELISWDNIGDKIEFFVTAITKTLNALVDAINWDLIGSTFAEGINTIVKTLTLLYQGINWGAIGSSIGTAIDALFRDVDWVGIATLIGEKLNAIIDVLYGIFSSIDFERIGKDIFNGFNALLAKIKWEKLGATLAKAVNGLINFIYQGLTKFNWNKLSKSLMSSVNKFINDVDWKKLGETVSTLMVTALMFLHTAIREFDWVGFAKAIFNFMLGVDWINLLGSALGAVSGTFFHVATEIVMTLAGAFGKAFESFTSYFKEELDAAGGNIVEGLFNGITHVIDGVQQWIFDHIFTPFITAFKSAFGIASPSTVMEEQGNFIIEGLLNGITSAWTNITSFFSNGASTLIGLIKDAKWVKTGEETINNLKTGVSKKWSTVTKFFNNGTKDVISDIKNSDWRSAGETSVDKTESGVSNKWGKLSEYFSSGTNSIISKFENSKWKGTGETAVSKTQEGVSGKWSTLSTYFDTGVSNISNAIIKFNWGNAGNQIVSKLRTGVKNKWDGSIYSYFKEKITAVSEYIKGFNWSGVGGNIVNKLHEGLTNNWNKVSGFFNDKVESIKNKFYNTRWASIGEDICSGISRGLSNGWDWVTRKAGDLARAAYEAARNKLDINSPSKLFRDGVGMAIPEGLAAGIEKGSDLAIKAVQRLSESVGDTKMPDIEIPSIALGKIIPYDLGKTTNNNDTTLEDVASLLKYNQQRSLSRADIEDALRTVLPNMLRDYISFYIEDEQIARHANAGNVSLNRRFSTTG